MRRSGQVWSSSSLSHDMAGEAKARSNGSMHRGLPVSNDKAGETGRSMNVSVSMTQRRHRLAGAMGVEFGGPVSAGDGGPAGWKCHLGGPARRQLSLCVPASEFGTLSLLRLCLAIIGVWGGSVVVVVVVRDEAGADAGLLDCWQLRSESSCLTRARR